MTDRRTIKLPEIVKEKKFDKRKKKDKEQPEKVAVEIYGSAPISLLQSGCTLNELKAYIAIDSFQGAGDLAFPKVEQLARRAGMSVSACSMAISKLEYNGWIFRKRNYGKANSYVCLVSAMTTDELKKKNKRVERVEAARKNISRYSEKQNHPEHSEKQNIHATENQNEQHFEKQGDEHSENQNADYSEKQNDILKDQYKRSLEKNNIKDQEDPAPSLPDLAPFKITIGNFINTFIQRHSEFSPMRTKASRESADRMNMPFDDLDCEMRMEELINLAKMYDEIIWRSNELSTWYKNKGFLTAMPVTITYLTRKKKDIEDAFGSLPVMDYMDRANKEHNEYLSTLNAPKTSSQIIAEREAAGEVIDYSMIL